MSNDNGSNGSLRNSDPHSHSPHNSVVHDRDDAEPTVLHTLPLPELHGVDPLPALNPQEIEIDKTDDFVIRTQHDDIEMAAAAAAGPGGTITAHNAVEFAHQGGDTRKERAARGDMEQNYLIPLAGGGRALGPVGRWEKYTFMVFRMSVGGVAISKYGSTRQQALIHQHFKDGYMPFAGRMIPVNSYLTNLTGFTFAAQFICLMMIGPYADYGTWRPWLLIVGEAITYICCFVLAALSNPEQWLPATVFYAIGVIALNTANVFYYATFPTIVRSLPEVLESEKATFEGRKEPEEHVNFHSIQKAKFYNYCIIVASTINLILLGIATGIAAGIGNHTDAEKQKGYRWLIVFFTLMEISMVSPYLYIFVRNPRPGQQVPDGTPFYLAGVKQAYRALRYIKDLKQFAIYLVGYFIIQEAFGGSGTIQQILQNEVIQFNTVQSTLLNALSFFTGATGTFFIGWVQRRWNFTNKQILLWGGTQILFMKLWGAIGSVTNVIGFHHVWEFWFSDESWNFFQASWNSYYVIFCSELVPAPKMYMFFALLNVVGETSGFSGPFISAVLVVSAAIIDVAKGNTNMAFWYILGTGILGFIIICFVDVDKARIDVARFLEREAEQLYSEERRMETKTAQFQE